MRIGHRCRGITRTGVIVIIAVLLVLAGLAIPGILAMRELDRSATCIQRQQQLASACRTYPEYFHEYPGCSNKIHNKTTGTDVRATWIVQLLPYFDRSDLMDVWKGNREPIANQTATPTPFLEW